MQSDENSGEEGDARANLGGDQKVIGFLTEWVSAYNFIKGMVLLRQSLFSKQASETVAWSVTISYSILIYLSCLLALEIVMSTWILLSMLPLLLQWHDTNVICCEVIFSHYRLCIKKKSFGIKGKNGEINELQDKKGKK